MGKLVLCIDKGQANQPIDKWNTKLVDRDICETDESILQIIPYITLIDTESGDIFSYTCGKAGQENRLHSKISIGIGGHIDINTASDFNIFELIASEANREIFEEVGYVADPKQIENWLRKGMYKLIYLPQSDNAVDRVRIGLAFVVYLNKKDLTKLEEKVIVEPKWLTITDLVNFYKEKQIRLEAWTVEIVKIIKTQLELDEPKKISVQKVSIEFPTSDSVFSICLNLTKETTSEQLLRWEQGSSPLFGYSLKGKETIYGRTLGANAICTIEECLELELTK